MQDDDKINDMPQLRLAIDKLDAELIVLLAKRASYIDQAIAIKSRSVLPARISKRVSQVILNARNNADNAGLDADLAECLWQEIVEWSIRREEAVLGDSAEKKENAK